MSATAPFELDPEALKCPYPHFEAIRAMGRAPYLDEVDARVVTAYADITDVMRRPGVASSGTPTGPVTNRTLSQNISEALREDLLTAEARQHLERPHARTLFTIDPPEHTRQRRVVSRFFAPFKIVAWEPKVREVAGEVVDAFLANGGGDFVEEVAVALPVRVIAWLLRIPPEDSAKVKHWSNKLTAVIGVNHPSLDQTVDMMANRAEMTNYFEAALAEARAHPGSDLVYDIAVGGVEEESGDGPVLTDSERIGLLINFLVAGNETSTKLFSNCARRLAEQPELWAALKADRSLVPNFVEEVVRLDPPSQMMYRQLKEEAEVGGEQCPAGQHVLMLFAAGNRDPDAFPNPNEVVLDRPDPKSHLSFGHGAHLCLGAPLARMEARIMLETMLDRMDTIELAPGNDFAMEPSYLLHGLLHLNLEVS